MYVVCVTMEKITRFGVSIEPELLEKFDKTIKEKRYANRSEAIRDLIREKLLFQKKRDPKAEAIGTLTMVYNHHAGGLASKLLNIQHKHHEQTLTTTHIHIDNHNCLEVLVLKGKTGEMQKLADEIRGLKGIKHGELVITQSQV